MIEENKFRKHGEIARLDLDNIKRKNAETHLQIPNIFLKTYEWLDKVKHRGF